MEDGEAERTFSGVLLDGIGRKNIFGKRCLPRVPFINSDDE